MEKVKSYIEKVKSYIELHLNILVFSLTSIFSKLAAMEYDEKGLHSKFLYLLILLMFLNCAMYAFAWQKIIKKFSLSTAYAHKSVYLIWSQVWAVLIFHENLSMLNIIGMLIVFCGVLVVQRYE